MQEPGKSGVGFTGENLLESGERVLQLWNWKVRRKGQLFESGNRLQRLVRRLVARPFASGIGTFGNRSVPLRLGRAQHVPGGSSLRRELIPGRLGVAVLYRSCHHCGLSESQCDPRLYYLVIHDPAADVQWARCHAGVAVGLLLSAARQWSPASDVFRI